MQASITAKAVIRIEVNSKKTAKNLDTRHAEVEAIQVYALFIPEPGIV
jgi:hypothetical protein